MKIELSETVSNELVEEIAKKSIKNEIFIDEIAEKIKKNVATPWMNKKETCEYIGVSNNTLTKWINDFGFPVSRINSRYFFKPNDVDDWMKMHY